jgi:hypothetical protein
MPATGRFIYQDEFNVLYEQTWTTTRGGDTRLTVTISDPRVYGTIQRRARDGQGWKTTGRITTQTIVFRTESDGSLTVLSQSPVVETIGGIHYRGPCEPRYQDLFCVHLNNALAEDVEFEYGTG